MTPVSIDSPTSDDECLARLQAAIRRHRDEELAEIARLIAQLAVVVEV
jgi:hypothetical protein